MGQEKEEKQHRSTGLDDQSIHPSILLSVCLSLRLSAHQGYLDSSKKHHMEQKEGE